MAVMTISLLARKGGVGRTTTTLNLAGVWAKEGARVLCFDMDSQASLSRCLLGSELVETRHASETIAGLFDQRYDPEPEEVAIIPEEATDEPVVSAAESTQEPEAEG